MSDPTSQSNYDQVATDHVDFEWSLDFDRRVIKGTATHHLIVKGNNVKEVMFVLRSIPQHQRTHCSSLYDPDLTPMI
jgi:hypothetical protein